MYVLRRENAPCVLATTLFGATARSVLRLKDTEPTINWWCQRNRGNAQLQYDWRTKPSLSISGAAFLDAVSLQPLKLTKSLTPEWVKELERLRQDGHTISEDKRHYFVDMT